MKKGWKSKVKLFGLIFCIGMLCGCGAKNTVTEDASVIEKDEEKVNAETETQETETQETEASNDAVAETERQTEVQEEVKQSEQQSLTESRYFVIEAGEEGCITLTEEYFEEYNIIAVPVGMGCDVDLDGNGTPEEIVYEPQSSDGVNYEFLFYIRDSETEEFAGGMEGWSITEMFWPSMDYYFVMDLDSTDNYRELVFLDEGPSDDPVFYFLRYRDGETVYMGSVFTDSPYNELAINGDGKISGSGRLSVLQTWNAPFTWAVENEKISLTEEKWYYPYDRTEFGQEIKLIKKINIYKEADLESEIIEVEPSDETVTFTCTDNKNWVQLKMGDVEGWIYLKDGFWMEIDGEEVPTEQVFEDLFFAG